jgi:hypothetical protein
MGWALPAILAGKGAFDYFSGKQKEKKQVNFAKNQADQDWNRRFALANWYLDHKGLRDKLPPQLLQALLQRPATPGTAGKIPGLGGGLFSALIGALGQTKFGGGTSKSGGGSGLGPTSGFYGV